jgi:endonuclease/exonuclease/phosphatase family metal-dependent hydrolase
LPPILCGDFNAEPDADEIRYLSGFTTLEGRSVYFADCFRVAGDGSNGHTFCRRNPYAASVREPDRRIDYIFVRGPDKQGRGEPLTCRVVFDQPNADGVFASDHFGVLAEISTR